MGRSTAAADAAAAAVEEREPDVVPPAGGDDLFLRPVQRPRGGEAAGVLRRIGVADHHLLVPRDARAVRGDREQRVDHRAGTLQIGGGLEQRHHALRIGIPRESLEQIDGEDVGRAARHRDHVCAERSTRQRRGGAERVERVPHRIRDRIAIACEVGERAAAVARFANQHGDAFVFRRLVIRAQVPRARDPGNRFGMAARFLAQVERRQGDAECRHAAEDVGQAPGGDQLIAGFHQRAMAEQQRRGELGGGQQRRRRCRCGSVVVDSGCGVRAGRAEPRRDAAQQRAVGFVGIGDQLTQFL